MLENQFLPDYLLDGQGSVDLGNGLVHMLERFPGESGADLLENSLGRFQLGVGSGLRLVSPTVAADVAAKFFDRPLDLRHRFGAMPFVVVVGLGEGRVSLIQHGDVAVGLSLSARHETKSQKQGGEQGGIAEIELVCHGGKLAIKLVFVKLEQEVEVRIKVRLLPPANSVPSPRGLSGGCFSSVNAGK